ncbi:MAG: hypothetical protein WA705_01635 [Candidatus Ozemobacteraceae bacterium]
MAIPAVLAIALILGILGLALLRGTREQSRQNLTSLNQLQVHFLAKAAFQHALLKVKYLGRELYDAACIAQGRNPLFDFSRPISAFNPGPIFLYRKGEAKPDGFLTSGLEAALANASSPPLLWLEAFRSDLVSGTTTQANRMNTCMSFESSPFAPRDIHGGKATGRYSITALSLAAADVSENPGKNLENRVVVELTVQSEVISSRGEAFRQESKQLIRVSRE